MNTITTVTSPNGFRVRFEFLAGAGEKTIIGEPPPRGGDRDVARRLRVYDARARGAGHRAVRADGVVGRDAAR